MRTKLAVAFGIAALVWGTGKADAQVISATTYPFSTATGVALKESLGRVLPGGRRR